MGQTCIKRHRIKRSPYIKRLVVKVLNLFSLNHCNFHLYFVFHLYRTVAERIIIQIIFSPCLSPKIKASSIFERGSLRLVVNYGIIYRFL